MLTKCWKKLFSIEVEVI